MGKGNDWRSFPNKYNEIFPFILAETDRRRGGFRQGSSQWERITQAAVLCFRDARLKLVCGGAAASRIDAAYIEGVKREFVEQLDDCERILAQGTLDDIREAYPPFRDNKALWAWLDGQALEHPLKRLHRLRFHPDALEPGKPELF